MRATPFTRLTIICAVEMFDRHSHAKFDQMATRLGLERLLSRGPGISVAQKVAQLAPIVLEHSVSILDTIDGAMTLAEAVVREAVRLLHSPSLNEMDDRLTRTLVRDGFDVVWSTSGTGASLRAALPISIELPAADDEVHSLLKHLGFFEALSHLDQAIEAHTRGDWAAANSQLRTHFESLTRSLANRVAPSEADNNTERCRQLLARYGFFSETRNEWRPDGQGYLNGLFKMLSTDGSHPGLSDDDHATFRLHAVLVVSRTLLRRLVLP